MLVGFLIESPGKARVVSQHLDDSSIDQERYPVVEVTEVPEPVPQPGKVPVLYVNPETKDLWYEYIDKPLPTEELLARIEDLELAIAALLGQ